MSQEWFLVVLGKLQNSEHILKYNNLIKTRIKLWDEHLKKEDSSTEILYDFLNSF